MAADKPRKKGPKTAAEKQAKLRELAERRVPRALNAIKLVGNLGKYGPTPPQSNAIGKALKDAIDAAYDQLSRPTAKVASEFKLP